MIISFIGVRGAGKTTQCQMLESYLLNSGRSACVVKAFDDDMKSKFLEMISRNSYLANVFLFCMLYRRQVDTIDKFQLEGRLVITDRFIEHFLLFHRHDGLMKTHGEETYKVLESLVFGHARPTVSVYLVVGLTSANKRIAARLAGGSRTDYMFETEESYRRAVELYEEIAATENCKVIDGIGDQLLVHQRVVDALNLQLC